jgi:hypothetical protein
MCLNSIETQMRCYTTPTSESQVRLIKKWRGKAQVYK